MERPMVIDGIFDLGLKMSDEYSCRNKCANLGIVRRKLSNATTPYWVQCKDCGKGIRAIKGIIADQVVKKGCIIREWDSDLVKKTAAEWADHAHYQQLIQKELTEARRKDYNAYLNSPDWNKLRNLVLERDNRLCQGCLVAPAEIVHHLTYNDVFYELAFQLVSLCRACHEKIHAAGGAYEPV
jgi:hypothetical protein